MRCIRCGTEFEGLFCPECGTKNDELHKEIVGCKTTIAKCLEEQKQVETELNALIKQYDVENRTFNGKVYESEIDAKKAKKEFINEKERVLKCTFYGQIYDSPEAAQIAQEEYRKQMIEKKTKGMYDDASIASFVLGLLGIFTSIIYLGVPLDIIAIIIGIIAVSDKNHKPQLKYVGILCGLVGISAYILFSPSGILG